MKQRWFVSYASCGRARQSRLIVLRQTRAAGSGGGITDTQHVYARSEAAEMAVTVAYRGAMRGCMLAGLNRVPACSPGSTAPTMNLGRTYRWGATARLPGFRETGGFAVAL